MRFWTLAILSALFVTTACQRPRSPISEKEKLANHVIRLAATKIKKETQLSPCGTMGQMLNEIQKLGLSFQYNQPVNIEEGRKLLIQAVSTMLDEVNQEERIHSYLIRYPFLPRNIQIEIFLHNPDGRSVSSGSLCIITSKDGILCYKIHRIDGPGFITVYKETYEEALERIKDPSLPLVPFQPDPKLSKEDLTTLRKGISFVADDGTIHHLDENGCWVKSPQRSR